MIHSRPITRGALRSGAGKPVDSTRLLPYSPRDEDDPATDGSALMTASSSPASRLADISVMGGSLPQSPELWADFMYSDYHCHPTTDCDLLPAISSPNGVLSEQILPDAMAFGLDPSMVPQTCLSDLDLFGLSAEELIPAMPETGFIPKSIMASIPSLQINQLDLYSSPRANSRRDSQLPLQPSSRARQRGRPSPAEDSGADDRSLSPGSEEERLQERRRRNKLASRRMRQKHLNHVSDLETRLQGVTQERDELRLQVAKWEGEAMALRKLLETRAND